MAHIIEKCLICDTLLVFKGRQRIRNKKGLNGDLAHGPKLPSQSAQLPYFLKISNFL